MQTPGLELSRRFDFSIPEAQALSDLTGISHDLKAVIRICERVMRIAPELQNSMQADPLKWIEERSAISDLVEAAVVRYGRTIGTGVRQGIPKEWLEELPPGMKTAHDHFKAIRDRSIAHSVNPLEDNQVWVWVRGDGVEASVTHITVDPGRFMFGDDGANELCDLASLLLERTDRQIEEEVLLVLKVAQTMPIAEIEARSPDELPIPVPKDASAIRQRFSPTGS
jgi:hypothetical protein